MLNSQNVRELAYLVYVDEVLPMNADRLECARVGGWNCVVGKGEFKAGDLAVYFEIDSKLPEVEPFNSMAFLVSKHYKIKSQKIRGVVSQGLLVHPSTLGWATIYDDNEVPLWVADKENVLHTVDDESRFLTEKLGVTYAVIEDNARKAPSTDKYKKMAQRYPKFARTKIWRWLMRRKWGKTILFVFFGRKKDRTKTSFPTKFQFVKKTDQERVENMTWVLQDKTPYIVTQKCDGSSATYILARTRNPFKPYEFYVCSRNVRMLNENQKCFYEDNVYWEMAIKYDIENKLKKFLNSAYAKEHKLAYMCLQGEICGPKIQKNPHSLKENHFFVFHIIDSAHGKYDMRGVGEVCRDLELECVPIIIDNFVMPNDFEELKVMADGFYDPSVCEGHTNCPREGFVYYKTTDPDFSFKNVSRKYLLNRGE